MIPAEQRSPNQPQPQEFIMSAINGDKSRFNRVRKQRIALRQRTRELLKNMTSQPKPAAASAGSQPKTVSA
jgi:hypothetical protein